MTTERYGDIRYIMGDKRPPTEIPEDSGIYISITDLAFLLAEKGHDLAEQAEVEDWDAEDREMAASVTLGGMAVIMFLADLESYHLTLKDEKPLTDAAIAEFLRDAGES